MAVVMPIETYCLELFRQCSFRVILAAFHFVADDGKFRRQVFGRYARPKHSVGFHFQRPVQLLLTGSEAFIKVGPIIRSRSIEFPTFGVQLSNDILAFRRALEHHVFKQMGHSSFAIALMT